LTAQGDTTAVGGAAGSSVEGLISTRRSNASGWMALIGKLPIGAWELTLPNTEEMKPEKLISMLTLDRLRSLHVSLTLSLEKGCGESQTTIREPLVEEGMVGDHASFLRMSCLSK
jgi:hypothetical protein